MKKVVVFLWCMVVLSGCGKNQGSFQKGTMDVPSLYQEINGLTVDGKWNMGLLNDEMWNKSNIEQKYHLDMTKIKEAYVKSAVIAPQLSEIAIFKVDQEMDSLLQEGIQYRVTQLKNQWETYIPECNAWIQDAKQGRIGQYYYFIIGEDSEKVVDYIQNKGA